MNHKVLGRGRIASALWRAPRACVLTSQPAAAELRRWMAFLSHRSGAVICAVIACAPLLAMEASPRSLEATELGDVWLVRSSGTWSQSGAYGYYRVVLYKKVGEHAEDAVRVDILQAADGSEPLKLIRAISLPVPGYAGYVRDISFGKSTDTTIEIVFDVDLKESEGLVSTETYLVNVNGTYKLISTRRHHR